MTSIEVLTPRQVPLGGVRALEVRRTLPHKGRAFIGAWCFLDHYGPELVQDARRDGMDVPPHPHTGLQTVSWLFDGEIEHRDTHGVHAVVRPGEMNLMTSGHGIAHSEVSTPATQTLHGVQLWVALPDDAREGSRRFNHHAPEPSLLAGEDDGPAGQALVFLGELPGIDAAPIETATPLLGAELRLDHGARVSLRVDPQFEHGILLDAGDLTLEDEPLGRGDLAYVPEGTDVIHLSVGEMPVRAILIGGEPFEEEIVMWWNFIGRTHDEVARAREQYENGSRRFGVVNGYEGPVQRIPAPPLPPVRLKPRGRVRGPR